MAPTNVAAWLVDDKIVPLEVKPAPYSPPGEHEIVVRSGAVTINPADGAIQRVGKTGTFSHLKYPYILGTDVAGEVVDVGSSVTRFKIGDRVVGQGGAFYSNDTRRGTFQNYVLLHDYNTSIIPSSLSFEEACVLPLALATAMSGMYPKEYLGLQLPSLDPKPTGEVLVVWGGATSVGACAIQLAVNAGYEVVSTASPRNFEAVKKLGASQVFDYKSDTVVTDIIDALKDKTVAGYMAISNHWLPSKHNDVLSCAEIATKCKGSKFVATGGPPPEGVPAGVTAKFMYGTALSSSHREAIFGGFLEKALNTGKFVTAPPPLVFGKGLESIQAAMGRLAEGVSFQKVVVSLSN